MRPRSGEDTSGEAAGCGAARRMSLAAMLAVMFVAFILQIVFRYLLNFPIGWTSELTVITGSGWCCGAPPSS